MDFDSIDWNAMWMEASWYSHWNKAQEQELWDKRADSFSKRINRVKDGEPREKDDYISKMPDSIEVRPGWTVLDIGCGPGMLTIPLAQRAASVTALDVSSETLKRLKESAAKQGLDNIRFLNSFWPDAFENGEAGPYDVVIASRSMMAGDIKKGLTHILAIAKQAVYITFLIVYLSFDWEVYRAIGREKKRHPPYIYVYNMLFQIGVRANVENSLFEGQGADILYIRILSSTYIEVNK